MYKIYLKQAWQMLMQNRFISIIAILGTALAIMMILVIVMADTVQNARRRAGKQPQPDSIH